MQIYGNHTGLGWAHYFFSKLDILKNQFSKVFSKFQNHITIGNFRDFQLFCHKFLKFHKNQKLLDATCDSEHPYSINLPWGDAKSHTKFGPN